MNLDEIRKSKLEEINKISSESAANALSTMISKNIAIDFRDIQVDHVNNLNEIVNTSISSQCLLTGDVGGDLIVMFEKDKGLRIVDMMNARDIGTSLEINEDVKTSLNELLNIIGGAYVSAVANYFKIVILPKPPIFIDNVNVLHDALSSTIKKSEFEVLMSKVHLMVDGENVEGKILMLLDPDSLKKVHGFLSE